MRHGVTYIMTHWVKQNYKLKFISQALNWILFPYLSLEDGMVDHQEFQKWSNGGGLCHNLACIDPTAVVKFGAVIHERATLGANVHVGSGSVVGPCVRVGQSTSLGYGFWLLLLTSH